MSYICAYCKKEFIPKKKTSPHIFCSVPCRIKHGRKVTRTDCEFRNSIGLLDDNKFPDRKNNLE